MHKLFTLACASLLYGAIPAVNAANAAHAAPAAPAGFQCPVAAAAPATVPYEKTMLVFNEMNRALESTFGADIDHLDQPKVLARVTATKIDAAAMARLAQLSGCGALIDVASSCSQYFEPELGGPLYFLMEMKKTAPLRMQYEAAINDLADAQQKAAARQCIKLVGKK